MISPTGTDDYQFTNENDAYGLRLRKGETLQIRKFFIENGFTRQITRKQADDSRIYGYLALLSLLLLAPFTYISSFLGVVHGFAVGICLLMAGLSLYEFGSKQTRLFFFENIGSSIRYASWSISGYLFAIVGIIFLLSGFAAVFFEFSIINPDLVGLALINGLFSIVISWAVSYFIGPLSDLLLYLGIILLMLSGSIFLIMLFGGPSLLSIFVTGLEITAICFFFIASFFLYIGWRRDPHYLHRSLPIIKIGRLGIRIILLIWLMVSLIGDAIFFSVLLFRP
ncbi:MAG: hypothetical protein ACTSW4_03880 [Candidatus Ranarchaeia archaeon]